MLFPIFHFPSRGDGTGLAVYVHGLCERKTPEAGCNHIVIILLSDHITVLSFGQKNAEGKPAEIRSNRQVIEAYLGTREAAHG